AAFPEPFQQIAANGVGAIAVSERAFEQPASQPRRKGIRRLRRQPYVAAHVCLLRTPSSPLHIRCSTPRDERSAAIPAAVTEYRRRGRPSRAGVPPASFQRSSPFSSRRSSDV